MIRYLFSIFLICISTLLSAEDNVLIEDILVEGNRKTRKNIITRELDFKVGDSLNVESLMQHLEANRLLLMNTGLFTQVNMNIKKWDTAAKVIVIHIKLSENWYIYPFPIFELADRNFNVWWVEQDHDPGRLNLGLRLYYLNLTGRKDLLKTVTQIGYAQKLEANYILPFFNKAQTLGFSTDVMLSRSKEFAFTTQQNKLVFFRDDNKHLLNRLRLGAGISYRPKQRSIFRLSTTWYHNKVNKDFIRGKNPDFFLDGHATQQYIGIYGSYSYDSRNIKPYSTKGILLEAGFKKDGIGLFQQRNNLKLNFMLAKYFAAGKYLSWEIKGKAAMELIRKKHAYYNYRALGYQEDYLRGYEYYVIDGSDFGYVKSSFRIQCLSKSFNWGRAMPIKAFKEMPFIVYLTFNSDWGYVHDDYYASENELANRLLYGGGVGLDIVIYYDKVLQFEYSLNHLREKALFLHYNISF